MWAKRRKNNKDVKESTTLKTIKFPMNNFSSFCVFFSNPIWAICSKDNFGQQSDRRQTDISDSTHIPIRIHFCRRWNFNFYLPACFSSSLRSQGDKILTKYVEAWSVTKWNVKNHSFGFFTKKDEILKGQKAG